MPFVFSLLITVVSFIWLCYGYLVKDINIQVCIKLCYGYVVKDIETQVCIGLCYDYLMKDIEIQVCIWLRYHLWCYCYYEGNQHQGVGLCYAIVWRISILRCAYGPAHRTGYSFRHTRKIAQLASLLPGMKWVWAWNSCPCAWNFMPS